MDGLELEALKDALARDLASRDKYSYWTKALKMTTTNRKIVRVLLDHCNLTIKELIKLASKSDFE